MCQQRQRLVGAQEVRPLLAVAWPRDVRSEFVVTHHGDDRAVPLPAPRRIIGIEFLAFCVDQLFLDPIDGRRRERVEAGMKAEGFALFMAGPQKAGLAAVLYVFFRARAERDSGFATGDISLRCLVFDLPADSVCLCFVADLGRASDLN